MRTFQIIALAVVGAFTLSWALTVADATSGGYACSKVTWKDQRNKDRSVYIVKNSGTMTGVCPQITYYDENNTFRDVNNYGSDPLNNAFGSSTHHGSSTHKASGTLTQKFVGASMAVIDYNQVIDGTKETITYTFQDGHDYFGWAQTDDNTASTGEGDSRGPYCTMKWNCTGNTAQHVEYGAQKYYNQPVFNTNWTFGGTCDIPYVLESGDGLEIGYVATQTFTQQLAGSPTWQASLNMAASGTSMPFSETWKLDFQMCYYDGWLKITWGQPYWFMKKAGGAGAGCKGDWGQYSLSIMLDGKAQAGVLRVRNENRAIHSAKVAFTAVSPATVKTTGPVGTRNPATQTLSPAGWDHNFRAWWVQASGTSTTVNLNISDTTHLVSPTLRISGLTAVPSAVSLNGVAIASGTDYYASVDAANSEVWLTIAKSLAGNNTIAIGGAAAVSNPLQRAVTAGRFSFAAKANGSVVISVYSLNGMLMSTQTMPVIEGAVYNVKQDELVTSNSSLSKGTYVIAVNGAGVNVREAVLR
jgi:hypothetical protein